jgi:hypothetical protein
MVLHKQQTAFLVSFWPNPDQSGTNHNSLFSRTQLEYSGSKIENPVGYQPGSSPALQALGIHDGK